MTNGPTRSSDERLDTEIRRAVNEVVDLAPLPPTLDPASIRTARRPRRALAGTTLLFAVVIGLTGLAIWVVPKPDHQARQSQDPLSGPATTQVPPPPTLVGPSTAPRGLELVLGGTATLTGGPDALLLANETGTRTARLLFTPPGRAGCTTGQQVTTTSHAAGSRQTPPATQGAQPSLAEAQWQSAGDGFGALHWCDDAGRELNLVTRGLTQTEARELAATVRASATDPAAVDVDPPEGFVLGRELRSTRISRLLYERPGSASPRLEISVQTPWTRHLQLLAATAWSAELLQLGGRPSIALSNRPGKQGFDTYVVLWDDATLVTVRGEGITDQQLRAAAADLRPLDPSLAPENPNPLTCGRLGLCG